MSDLRPAPRGEKFRINYIRNSCPGVITKKKIITRAVLSTFGKYAPQYFVGFLLIPFPLGWGDGSNIQQGPADQQRKTQTVTHGCSFPYIF